MSNIFFDTFTGTPVSDPTLGDKHLVDTEFAIPVLELEHMQFAMPLAKFHIGTYPNTDVDSGPLAFVHCDCDQYASYRAVIDLMWPRIIPSGILLFDDYPYLLGARRAVEENFDKNELELTPAGRFFVRKR